MPQVEAVYSFLFTYYFKIFSDPGLQKIQHSALVCCCSFALIILLEMRSSPNVSVFKSKLKSFFSQAYNLS